MGKRGPDRKITADQILNVMETYDRPVWSAPDLADHLDTSRQTAAKRLKELEDRHQVMSMKVGGTRVYYPPQEGVDPDRPLIEQHKSSIIREFTDKFVGLRTAPWTAVHPNDGPAEAGDKVQIRVEGVPGRWREMITHTWEKRREELLYEETVDDETQALISGELYAKPTVPIEHTQYPDDYDLESNIGGQYQEIESRTQPILVVPGLKNYLVKPCNNAVFLKDVSVDWISPKGEGQELETYQIEEALENYSDDGEVADVGEPVKDSIPKPTRRDDEGDDDE